MSRFDACVIGGGPAGLAISCVLSLGGLNVAVLGPVASSRPDFGETLSPTVSEPLLELGLQQDFERLQLPTIAGFQSTWGSSKKIYRSALLSPNGGGWSLNREAFESMLRERAKRLGVQIIDGRAEQILRSGSVWRVAIKSACDIPLETELIVYAHGRDRCIVDSGGSGYCLDRMIACALSYQGSSVAGEDIVSVDALEDGWTYSVSSASRRRVIVYFSDSDLVRERKQPSIEALLEDAIALSPCVAELAGTWRNSSTRVMIRSAATVFKRIACGPGWLACGDAAQTLDPLSSRGIGFALEDAVDAGRSYLEFVRTNPRALEQREYRRRENFLRYLRKRSDYYGSEHRWAASKFWSRRSDFGQISKSLIS
jgi:flavin-dependent dehydrogenase